MSAASRGEQEFDDFKGDIEAAEWRVAREIDPGARALAIAIFVFVLLATLVLPHTGGARGLDVLIGSDAAISNGIALPSRVFAWFTLVFGVGFSMLALADPSVGAGVDRAGRLDGVVVPRAAGGVVAPDRAEPYPGPGIGLVLAWLAVILLAYNWARVVLTPYRAATGRRRAASPRGI